MELESSNEYFDKRLKEINDEMESLLEKTDRQRKQLHQEALHYQSATPPAYHPTTTPFPEEKGLTVGCSAALLAGRPTAGPVEQALVEQEVRKLCAAQVAKWIDTNLSAALTPLLESKMNLQLKDITAELQHIRGKQEEFGKEMEFLKKEWIEYKAMMQATLGDKERQNAGQLERFKESVDHRLTEWRADLNINLDSVTGLKNKFELSEKRAERRLEEGLGRHQEQIRSTILDLETQVVAWKNDLRHSLSKDIGEMRSQREAMETQCAHLEGLVTAASEMSTRHSTILKELMEDSVERRSEVRMCRRDVNRIDMLVQSVGFGGGRGAESESTHSSGGDRPTIALLTQEMFKTKERLHLVASHVESVERYIYQLEERMKRMNTAGPMRQRPGFPTSRGALPSGLNSLRSTPPTQQEAAHPSLSQSPSEADRRNDVQEGEGEEERRPSTTSSQSNTPNFEKTQLHVPVGKAIPKELSPSSRPLSPQRRSPHKVMDIEFNERSSDDSAKKTPSQRASKSDSAVPSQQSPVDSYVSEVPDPDGAATPASAEDSYVSEKKSPSTAEDSYVSEGNNSNPNRFSNP